MGSHWRRRSHKKVWIGYVSFELIFWLAVMGVEIWWLSTRNDPSFPDNPATSYRACCTPEFYNTVGACPNYGSPHPECDPGIDISELGTNGDMVFFFAVTVVFTVTYIVYLVLGMQILRLTDMHLKVTICSRLWRFSSLSRNSLTISVQTHRTKTPAALQSLPQSPGRRWAVLLRRQQQQNRREARPASCR